MDEVPTQANFNRHVPGSHASTVKVDQWWNSAFRVNLQYGGTFGSFLRSFHRKPAILADVPNTASMWPMPLPFPWVLVKNGLGVSPAGPKFTLQKGVNLVIATLNWLHLRRPLTCPSEICLHAKLNKLQWRVVLQVERTLEAWNVCEPVTAESMGRSAAKMEDIESAIARLGSFEEVAAAVFETSVSEGSGGKRPVVRKASFFSPGLQRTFAGEVCGTLQGRDMIAAKSIEAERLEFRGEPVFDPTPFLDPVGQRIFQHPIAMAKDPCELEGPIPPVRIFASETEKWALLRKLDSSGRLGVVRSSEVLPGFQAGLFSVLKDGLRDRLIFDSRPFNCLETVPRRWIRSMANACNLCDLHLGPDEDFVVSGTDLREFYYSFAVSQERVVRNSLLVSVWPWEIWGFRCYEPSLEAGTRPLFLGLRTLAMGDSQAVELAQTAHVGLLFQAGLLVPEALISMGMPIPRSPVMLGVIIDDLIVFERLLKGSTLDFPGLPSCALLDSAVGKYTEVGLLPHPGKTFHGMYQSEFWGSLFEGDRGFVRASLKRVVPVVFATLGVVKLGVCTISLLEVLVGCWNSIFLFRRRMLSLFNVCYEALQRAEDRRSVIRLSPELRTELLLFVNLAPVAATCIRTLDSPVLYASDASDWGWAACSAELPEVLRSEVHRHKLSKPVWAKLLSPLRAVQRLKGLLAPADELPSGWFYLLIPCLWIWLPLFSFRWIRRRLFDAPPI